jgi:surfeit locus 1 family protein
MNTKARRLMVPAVSTAAMLVILLGLGTWQVERLAWKTGILAQIARGEASPAIPLPADPPAFTKVSVHGTMRNDLQAFYGADVRDTPAGTVLGAQLVVPLERTGQTTILVDRGWVPIDRPVTVPPLLGQTDVEGYIRAPDHPGLFSASDDVAGRKFYTLDPAAIGAAFGLKDVAPFTLVAIGPAPQGGIPDPARHLPRPPNDHLSYAITWYGLAVTLLVIFALYARKVIRP